MRFTVFIFLLGLVQACASNAPASGTQERFTPQILDNGTKLFRYEFSRGDKLRPILAYDQAGGFSDGRDVYSAEELRRKNERHLRFAVPRLLEENGYCREGFYTLDTLIGYGNASLRGECKEAATAEDRARFDKPSEQSASKQP
ncbi:hypothetical protein FHR99_001908 [Litorivivens lipolytica]|uniref:Lipoprotein n=1 Tax=Litorivivens lipolytica TaxID=1524264 RepID=A0A7W4Z5Z8_9GAMM|nr:hypothetical protein [Litorivivens lipolytica]MBB3047642.1 hypothetical protein [Litorivivens lipolytica]